MDDVDRARAQSEALKEHRLSSASRNRFWAGLNRSLAEENERTAAQNEQEEAGRQGR